MKTLFNMTTPPYLMEILNNCFQATYLIDKEEQEYIATAGVREILCTIKNFDCNCQTIVDFADDIAIFLMA